MGWWAKALLVVGECPVPGSLNYLIAGWLDSTYYDMFRLLIVQLL